MTDRGDTPPPCRAPGCTHAGRYADRRHAPDEWYCMGHYLFGTISTPNLRGILDVTNDCPCGDPDTGPCELCEKYRRTA